MRLEQNFNSEKNDRDKGYLKLGVAMCMIASISASVSFSFWNHKTMPDNEEESLEQHYPFTYPGRRIAMQDFLNQKIFSSGNLFLVQYRGFYYVVNSNLNIVGTEDFFQIVDSLDERGKKYQIFEEDVIPFSTVLNNGKAQVTLLEAYEMIEQWNHEIPLFPTSPEITYPLNENPIEDGMNYARNIDSREDVCSYPLSDLYVINQNGNLYLCQENIPKLFSILHNGMDEANTFTFSLCEEEANISKCQIQKFSNILTQAGFSYQEHSSYSLVSCYQLLDTACNILGGIDFSPCYESYQGFTKSQQQYANQFLTYGNYYLDDFHMNSHSSYQLYSLEDIWIVDLGNHNFVLATSVDYEEEEQCYSVEPLQLSNQKLPKLSGFSHVFAIPFSSLFDIPDMNPQTASYYYTVFRDFLVKNGPDFLAHRSDFREESNISPVLEDLGKRLSLRLTYSK